ncbi:MAG TPA: hypothetical protein VE715_00395 [Blastocatellia bacterium]|nr:hypothetical protein [Blastocatellia bacterium]
MIGSTEFNKIDQGWALPMLPEMAAAAGVAAGSILVLHVQPGKVEVEILPPPTEEMKQAVQESIDKFGEAFEEMQLT